MAFRIAAQPPQVAASKRTKPVKRDNYRAWLKTLPCVLTGRTPVDAAHISTANLSYGHLGRGKGRKASDRWAVPLCRQLHDAQHDSNEAEFWKAAKRDPYIIALTLYGLYSDLGDEATEIASQLILRRKVGKMSEFGHKGVIGAGFCFDTWGGNHFRISVNGKEYDFEDSDRFGPALLRKDGELKKNPYPHERHPFWEAHSQWCKQGRRLADDGITCIYDPVNYPTCRIEGKQIIMLTEGDADCYEIIDVTDPKKPRMINLLDRRP